MDVFSLEIIFKGFIVVGGGVLKKKKFFEVLGFDRVNGDYYKLGYTDDKEKARKYHEEMGWKREDLYFKEVVKEKK